MLNTIKIGKQDVELSKIIAIKRYHFNNDEKTQSERQDGAANEADQQQQQQRVRKLKIYYAKQCDKLLKLERICLNESKQQNNGDELGAKSCEQQETVARVKLDEFAQMIEQQLERRAREQRRPRRLLIFVNPYGGKGKALQIFKARVRRLLQLAHVDYELVVTEYANHARETIEDPQFQLEGRFDGIVCIGGDGMFSELMNGLLFRCNRGAMEPAAPRAGACTDELELMRSAYGGLGRRFKSPKLPIGVIGAGSTDANLFGFIGTNDATSATLNIILGQQIDIDVCSIHSLKSDRLLRFVSTFIAYGYFGDVVRESEAWRWMGPTRYDLSAVNNLIKYRVYDGLVRIWRSPTDGSPQDLKARCHVNCTQCAPYQKDATREIADATCDLQKLELIERPGPFVGVNAAVTACRCPQTRKGFSPGNHLANGCADLILVRPCTRMQYLTYLLRTGYTSKSAFDLKYIDAHRCRQFEFLAGTQQHKRDANSSDADTPSLSSGSGRVASQNDLHTPTLANSNSSSTSSKLNGTQSKHEGVSVSSWNADGEILRERSIRVKVNERLLRVFGTGEPES